MTMEVKEKEAEVEALEQTTVTAHPYCTHIHTVVKGSPAVHVDHDNTPEEELHTHCTRGGNGEQGHVESSGRQTQGRRYGGRKEEKAII